MKRLWQFLNAPLIVAFISIGLVLGLMALNLHRIFNLFDQSETQRNQIEALGRLQLISFAEAETATNAPQKYVGTIRNNSAFIVRDVKAAVCAYDAQGNLMDVLARDLSAIGSIPPGQQREFYIERINDWGDERTPSAKLSADKTTITFVDTRVTKTKE